MHFTCSILGLVWTYYQYLKCEIFDRIFTSWWNFQLVFGIKLAVELCGLEVGEIGLTYSRLQGWNWLEFLEKLDGAVQFLLKSKSFLEFLWIGEKVEVFCISMEISIANR